jgi:CcmD family protein
MNEGGVLWLAAVNLIIWTGLFLYLLGLEGKIARAKGES